VRRLLLRLAIAAPGRSGSPSAPTTRGCPPRAGRGRASGTKDPR